MGNFPPVSSLTADAIAAARRDGALEADVQNLKGWARNIDAKLNLIIGGGFIQLLGWFAYLAWYVVQHPSGGH